jgi:hypothetical protein
LRVRKIINVAMSQTRRVEDKDCLWRSLRMAAQLRLRVDVFLAHCRANGWEFENQQAAGLGVAPSTVNRVLKGTQRPGGQFISAVLRAFPDADFTELFELGSGDFDARARSDPQLVGRESDQPAIAEQAQPEDPHLGRGSA